MTESSGETSTATDNGNTSTNPLNPPTTNPLPQSHSPQLTFDPNRLLDAINAIPEKIVRGLREATPAPPAQQNSSIKSDDEKEELKAIPGKQVKQPEDNRSSFARWYFGE